MIRLIRMDGVEILLNHDLIKFVEETPDTVITLINGEKLIVKNNLKDVQEKVRACRIGINSERSFWRTDQQENPSASEEN